MIESKTLGDAVGIQRGDVIDNSTKRNWVMLSDGMVIGRFKRGRIDRPFMVTAANYQALLGYDPSNPSFVVVDDAFRNGLKQLTVMRLGKPMLATAQVVIPPKPDNEPASVIINGIFRVGEVLTAVATDPNGVPSAVSYQWLANGVEVSTASSYSLTEADKGKTIVLSVTFIDNDGFTESATSTVSVPVAALNKPASVIINGELLVGSTLTGVITDANGVPSNVVYKWLLDGIEASVSMIDYLMRGAGTSALAYAASQLIGDGVDYVLDSANNSIKYKTAVIYTITESRLTVTGASPTEVSNNYITTHASLNTPSTYYGIFTFISATTTTATLNFNGWPDVRSSGWSISTKNIVSNASNIDADGYAHIALTLVADSIIASAEAGHVESQDFVNSVNTASSYLLGENDKGKTVALNVAFDDNDGFTELVTSTPSAPVAALNKLARVTINGTAKVGEILTANVTDANGVPSNIAYQWLADSVAISGAINNNYVLQDIEVGKTITVTASFNDNDGFTESVTSAASVVVEVLPVALSGVLSFTSENLKGTVELPLTITLFNPLNDWELLESGVKVADSSGYLKAGITSSISSDVWQNGATLINLATGGSVKSYELRGVIEVVTVEHKNLNPSAGVNGNLKVLEFSSGINRLSLRARNTNLTVPSVLPRHITTLNGMFMYCDLFNQNISAWDTSNITDMNNAFYDCTSFNQPIGTWNTSNVTSMSSVFIGNRAFNQPIGSWNTSKVTSMTYMFRFAIKFNQNISGWDTSNVTDMRQMFYYTDNFNQNISNWNVSKVTIMNNMFGRALLFNQNISGWNVSSAIDMVDMFIGAKAFNQDLSGWCVSKILSKPVGFNSETSQWTLPKPIWGTCPRGENVPA